MVCLCRRFLHILQDSQPGPFFSWQVFSTQCIIERQRYVYRFWHSSNSYTDQDPSVWQYCTRCSDSTHSRLSSTLALSSLLRAVPASDTHPLFTFTTSSNHFNCITGKSLNNGIKHLASLFLWILVIFLVTVSVAEELLSPFSAIFRLNLSNLKETGDLTLTCCTYPCLWQTDSCFVISFHSTFAIVICS